jgi:outer membrane protein assembly factor BamB
MKNPQMKTQTQPCPTWREQLSAMHPDDLKEAERKALGVHIATCAACASVYADYRRMDCLIEQLPPIREPVPLPTELQALIEQQKLAPSFSKSPALEPGSLQVGTYPSIVRTGQTARRPRPIVRLVSVLAAVLVVAMLVAGVIVRSDLLPLGHPRLEGSPHPALPQPVVYMSWYGPDFVNGFQDPQTLNRTDVAAFDPETGKTYWHTRLPMWASTPGFLQSVNGMLFVAGNNGKIYALGALNGSILWTHDLGKVIPTYPIADGNAVYFGSTDGFYALHIQNGRQIWHTKATPTCQGKAPTRKVQGQTIYELDGPPSKCNMIIAAVSGGSIYASFEGLSALRASDGQRLWNNKTASFFGPDSLKVVGEKVYILLDKLYSYERRDGKALQPVSLNAPVVLLPTVLATSGATLFVCMRAADGRDLSYVVAIRSSDNKILWQKQTPYHSAYVVASDDRNVYVSTYDNQHQDYVAYNVNSGAMAWRVARSGADMTNFVAMHGRLYHTIWKINLGWEVLHDGKRDFHPIKQ